MLVRLGSALGQRSGRGMVGQDKGCDWPTSRQEDDYDALGG